MVQTSVQFTPVQVLQAARRAEAEGKMDYALQFYRHLVEQHGTTPEAQEAREGLFRIAEWRWGEARVARSREAGGAGATPPQNSAPAQPPQSPPSGATGQRVYNVANTPPQQQPSNYYSEQPQSGAATGKLPQVAREHDQAGEDLPPFRPRFKIAKFAATVLSALGWITLVAGIGGGGRGIGRYLCSAVDTGPARTARLAFCSAPRPWCSGSSSSSLANWLSRCSRAPMRSSSSLPSSAGARASERGARSAARLFQARHDIDEIAGPVAAVELPLENAVPRVLAGSWRPRQTEDIGAVGSAAAGARLDCRRRDALEREHVEDRPRSPRSLSRTAASRHPASRRVR